jgi:hypothetical protein
MKPQLLSGLLLLIIGCAPEPKMPTVAYHGEHFRLVQSFEDYDDYKEAEQNIHPAEIDRIEAKTLSVQIPNEFATRQEFILASLRIKFPGYGFGGLDSAEGILTATIEIPQKEAYRYITVIEKNGRWRIVDDFKGPIAYGGTTVEIQSGELVYKTYKGEEFRRKRLN